MARNEMHKFYYVVGWKNDYGYNCTVMDFVEGVNIAGAFGDADLVRPCKTRKQAYELGQAWNEQRLERQRMANAVKKAETTPTTAETRNGYIDEWASETLVLFAEDHEGESFRSVEEFYKSVREYGRDSYSCNWFTESEESAVEEINTNREFYAEVAERAKASGTEFTFLTKFPMDYLDSAYGEILGLWAEKFFETHPIANYTTLDERVIAEIKARMTDNGTGIADMAFGR